MELANEITYLNLEPKFNVPRDIVGWGSEKLVHKNFPIEFVTMSRVLEQMPIRMAHEKACVHHYENIKFDEERLACGYGLGNELTSRVSDFINLSYFEIFFKQHFSYSLQGDIGNPILRENKLMEMVTGITTSKRNTLPTIFIKVLKFK